MRPSARHDRVSRRGITGLSPEEIVARGIIQVPEGRRVFPRLTVQQNLTAGAYSPRAHGKEKSTREQVFALFPRLYERRRQLAGSLSGGEQQMLAFGRAMMAQPVLLLLDEPSLGLAPIVIEEVAKAIEHFRADGVTVLLVEQNAELALTLATRGYVIETGSIVLADSSERLLQNPQVWASYLGQEDWELKRLQQFAGRSPGGALKSRNPNHRRFDHACAEFEHPYASPRCSWRPPRSPRPPRPSRSACSAR